MQKEESLPHNYSQYNLALRGGVKKLGLYIQETIEHNNLVKPLVCKRYDNLRSPINIYLNLLYNGSTVSNLPY